MLVSKSAASSSSTLFTRYEPGASGGAGYKGGEAGGDGESNTRWNMKDAEEPLTKV